MPGLFISTAEASAELHASRLVAFLRQTTPDLEVDAAGGPVLAGAGAEVVVDMGGRAVMGFWEALGQVAFYRRAGQAILSRLAARRHGALVLVDAPSFHLRLARKVHARWPELPIIYYIAPKLWAWKEWRIKNLRRDISRTLCIFPFETDFFRQRGVDAVYVGNPTRDQLRGVSGEAMAARLGLGSGWRRADPARGLLSVFPGSRVSEIRHIWPCQAAALAILHRRFPNLRAAVALAPGLEAGRLAAFAPIPEWAAAVAGDSHGLLAASSVVLAKSGTTTLEAALLGKPMAVCYAGHWISHRIARTFVKLPHFSLPNILAGREIVREFLQERAAPENLAAEIGRLLIDEPYRRRMRSRLGQLRETLGDMPAAESAAREIGAYLPKGGSERSFPVASGDRRPYHGSREGRHISVPPD
ncbi:MAG: lipid-A-disaccharide synthase [Planctomycetota bacterium]|jgi:lipid-A-disaccharide synthase|nr:lipid-A-disaccharide synthase [Planctomycetota bacterium]